MPIFASSFINLLFVEVKRPIVDRACMFMRLCVQAAVAACALQHACSCMIFFIFEIRTRQTIE